MFRLQSHFSLGEYPQSQFFVDYVNLLVRRVLILIFTALERFKVGFEYIQEIHDRKLLHVVYFR